MFWCRNNAIRFSPLFKCILNTISTATLIHSLIYFSFIELQVQTLVNSDTLLVIFYLPLNWFVNIKHSNTRSFIISSIEGISKQYSEPNTELKVSISDKRLHFYEMTHLIGTHFDHRRYDFDCHVHIRCSTSIEFYYFDSLFCYKICSDLKYFPRRMLIFGRHFFQLKLWSSTCFALNLPGTPAEEFHKIMLNF